MSNLTVYVKNISLQTRDSEVKDFFSFCGKITGIEVATEGETKSAEVTFEKETATKTALLLDNTQLGSTHISVTGPQNLAEVESSHAKNDDSEEITQEQKPRARIVAEYLAHGYLVGDVALKRAIELDEKHGVSHSFLNKLRELDQKYHATDRAKASDNTYGITQRANNFINSLSTYFEHAGNTPTGKKVVGFYEKSYKEVGDIHNEARRLADLRKQEHGGSAYKAAGLERIFGKERTAGVPPAASAEAPPTTEKTAAEEKKSG